MGGGTSFPREVWVFFRRGWAGSHSPFPWEMPLTPLGTRPGCGSVCNRRLRRGRAGSSAFARCRLLGRRRVRGCSEPHTPSEGSKGELLAGGGLWRGWAQGPCSGRDGEGRAGTTVGASRALCWRDVERAEFVCVNSASPLLSSGFESNVRGESKQHADGLLPALVARLSSFPASLPAGCESGSPQSQDGFGLSEASWAAKGLTARSAAWPGSTGGFRSWVPSCAPGGT